MYYTLKGWVIVLILNLLEYTEGENEFRGLLKLYIFLLFQGQTIKDWQCIKIIIPVLVNFQDFDWLGACLY